MNNALLEDSGIEIADITRSMQERRTELNKLITAIETVVNTEEWHNLKELLFDKAVARIEKSIEAESKKDELNAPKIYRLNGELAGVKRYQDLYKLAETYKSEFNHITKKLNENADI